MRVFRQISARLFCLALPVLVVTGGFVGLANAEKPFIDNPGHGIAVHTSLKYPADFTHLDYVNPNAPKGGRLTLGAQNGYDSFNLVASKGNAPSSLGLIYNTLMASATESPLSAYGMLAKHISLSEDRKTMIFQLHPHAKWHDGKAITAADVEFSFNLLTAETSTPLWRQYYHEVTSVKATGLLEVTVQFANGDNAELPIIIGQFPILPKHWWETRDASKTFLEAPLGSGAYRIKDFEAGRHITYERVESYWGKDHPLEVGTANFNEIRYDYYKDANVIVEALKSGAIDLRVENVSKNWATAYEIPARTRGDLILKRFTHRRTQGMQGFAYNFRRPQFQEVKVREALAYAFDFEWSNKTLFYGQYQRSNSYFSNSELASSGLPSAAELAILNPLRGQIPAEVFTQTYAAPSTKEQSLRDNLRAANAILDAAGWQFGSDRIRTKNGVRLEMEILIVQPSFLRIVSPFVRNLKRIGVDASVRQIDVPSYIERLSKFDFDMIVASYRQSDSPGNEQVSFFGSSSANVPHSRNVAGLANPAIDSIINQLINTTSREKLVTATRALDRVLLWNYIVIPQWYADYDRYVYWNRFGIPKQTPKSGAAFITWWIDPQKDRALDR